MRFPRRAASAATLLLLLWAGQPRSEDRFPPYVQTFQSTNEAVRVTIYPRAFTNVRDYLDDKICGREPAGRPRGSKEKTARAVVQRQSKDRTWTRVWAAPLLNEVSPAAAAVTNDGRYLVTFDNWDWIGDNHNVLVFYGARGRPIRSLTLTDFLPDNYVSALLRSPSSPDWRGHSYFSEDGTKLILEVRIPSGYGGTPDYVERAFDLATGKALSPSDPRWNEALAAAERIAGPARSLPGAPLRIHTSITSDEVDCAADES